MGLLLVHSSTTNLHAPLTHTDFTFVIDSSTNQNNLSSPLAMPHILRADTLHTVKKVCLEFVL